MTSGDRGLQLDLLALPSTHPVALRMPGSSNFYFEQAFLGDDGTPYLLELSPATRVFSLSADGPPRALGPRLFACAGPAQLAGRTLYVDDCRAGVIHVLDLDHPSAWTTLSAGLLSSGERAVFGGFHGQPIQASASAVSPDGRVLAFLLRGPKGMELWSRPLDGSTPPHRLLSVGTLAGLRDAGIDHPQVFSGVVWGPGGLAIGLAQAAGGQFGTGSLGALVVRSDAGRAQVVPLGNLAPGAMAWEPGGHVLAFVDQIGDGGGFFQTRYQELRTVDAETGAVRQLAASNGTYNGSVAWSPDGRALAWSHATGLVQVIDVSGRILASLTVDGAPDAWTR